MTIKLSAEMFDAVTEVFNVCVGHAARALNELVGAEVQIQIPHVDILDTREAMRLFSEEDEYNLLGVSMTFSGGFGGEALLLLTAKSVQNLATKIATSHGLPPEEANTFEALIEVGNIMLTTGFSRIADLLDVRLNADLPNYITGLEDVRSRFAQQLSDDIIWFRFGFSADEVAVEGYIGFVTDPMHTFLHAVEKLLESSS